MFDAEALAALPSGREPWSLLRTAEAAVTADRIESGGLFVGTPALIGVHGASWADTTWRLGAIDVTDPDRGGTPLIAIPVEALESLTLTTALTPVAAAGSGAQAALAVREPAASWRGALALHTTPSGLAGSGNGVAPPIASMRGWNDVSLTARRAVESAPRALRVRARHAGRAGGARIADPPPVGCALAAGPCRLPAERGGRVAAARRGGRRGSSVRRPRPARRSHRARGAALRARPGGLYPLGVRGGAVARRAGVPGNRRDAAGGDSRRRRDRAASRRPRARAVRVPPPRAPLRRHRRGVARSTEIRREERARRWVSPSSNPPRPGAPRAPPPAA